MQPLKSVPQFLWHFIKRRPFAYALLVFTAIIWSVNEMFFSYFIKLIVNILSAQPTAVTHVYSMLAWPLGGLMGVWLTMEVAMRMQGFLMVKLFPILRAEIREQVFNYVRGHSHEYFSNNFAGNLANKLAELPNSCQTLIEIIIFSFTSIMVAVMIAIGLMWQTNPIFAGILILWLSLHIIVIAAFFKKIERLWETHSEASSMLTGKIVDSITNINNVRLFAQGTYESEYLGHFQQDEIVKAKQAMWVLEFMKVCHGLLAALLIFSMILILVYGWSHGWVTLGDFSLIGMLTFSLLGLIWYLSYQVNVYVRELGKIQSALALISKSYDVVDVPQAKELKVTQGEIKFEDVTFSYQENQLIFKNLNIHIPAGQKIGLVGFSGSGKTTFVNLLLRFYDVMSGRILIDGQSIHAVTQDSLRRNIAVIPQDPSLFHRTLLENIRYGCLNATEKEVIAAAKKAHCDEFIRYLPEGYQSLVGERGIKLSGGQRQRIAMARAILKNAPILLLDEATSALDSVTERMIQESLTELMRGRTTIVIAHRLSTLTGMDRILVFDQGEIVEDGAIDELLKAGGHFAKLWSMQTDGYLPEML